MIRTLGAAGIEAARLAAIREQEARNLAAAGVTAQRVNPDDIELTDCGGNVEGYLPAAVEKAEVEAFNKRQAKAKSLALAKRRKKYRAARAQGKAGRGQ